MAADLGVFFVTNSDGGDTLPLVIKPKNVESSSVDYLKQWINENQEILDEQLLKYGAILFKGFSVEEAIHFQDVVQSIEKELSNEYRGTSPRRLIPGTQFVFSASELPPRYPIPQHLEMSFLPAPPKRLFFCCLEAPTSLGGETSLCDYRKVYEQLDPKVRDRFETKGVMYIRNYPAKKAYFSEPLLMKGWQAVFDTKDKEIVEQELVKSGMNFEWGVNDHLCITNEASAVELHPITGEKIWFNHLAVFHWSMFHQEFGHIYQRLQQIYYLIFSWFVWIFQLSIVTVKGPKNMAMHTCFGDGSEIPLADVTHVRDTLYKNMVFNRWEKGDIVMIDNFRVSHGRQPYVGKRKIVVTWSKPLLKPSFKK